MGFAEGEEERARLELSLVLSRRGHIRTRWLLTTMLRLAVLEPEFLGGQIRRQPLDNPDELDLLRFPQLLVPLSLYFLAQDGLLLDRSRKPSPTCAQRPGHQPVSDPPYRLRKLRKDFQA
jgi:hypothetical protein